MITYPARQPEYAFETLEVGNYVLIRIKPERARVALAEYSARTVKRFLAERHPDGLHVWRIKDVQKRALSELEKALLQSIKRYEAQGDSKSARVIRRRLAKLTAEASRTA